MNIQQGQQKREYYPWVDSMKAFACILVVLAHLYPSLITAGLFPRTAFTSIAKAGIYTFHVPLFFICSGFLYQKANMVNSLRSWKDNVLSKLLNLGVPYFVFSIITILSKTLFADYVHKELRSDALKTLFSDPVAPYWYLFSLFIFFVAVPCMKTKKQAIIFFAITVLLKIFYIIDDNIIMIYLPFVIRSIGSELVWFAIGMLLPFCKDIKKTALSKIVMAVTLTVAIVLCIANYKIKTILHPFLNFITGILFVTFFILFFRELENKRLETFSKKFAPYFMPVFVMHTIFASAIRIFMLKLGINNSFIHLILGLLASFGLPVLYYKIAEKIPFLMFFIYPKKAINMIKSKQKNS